MNNLQRKGMQDLGVQDQQEPEFSSRPISKMNDAAPPLLKRNGSRLGSLVKGLSMSKLNLFNAAGKSGGIGKHHRQQKGSAGTVFTSKRKRGEMLRLVDGSSNPRDFIVHGILSLIALVESERKARQDKRYRELFHVIDKDKGGTINVSTELGETLIRLGLVIDAKVMRDAISHVCSRRGRKPDGWIDMNLSTPVYNEINVDEFQEVMRYLSNDDANEFDHIIKARNVFSVIDVDGDGRLSAEELWRICPDTDLNVSFEECKNTIINEFGEKGMTFQTFLEYLGCEGDSNELLAAEIEEIRKELEECLVTFQTFDLDGSGTIDISETAAVMRAMGHKVNQRELDDIFNLCDQVGSGEINFESFCLNVLCFSEEKARRLIRAHLEKSIELKIKTYSSDHTNNPSISDLLPSLCARLLKEEEIGTQNIPQSSEKVSKPPQNLEEVYIWQDFGQYARVQLEKCKISKAEMQKVLNRPFTIPVYKSHAEIFAVKFSPDGCKAALGTETGTLIMFDLTRPRPREIKRINAHYHHTLCLDWAPDGTKIVTGGADGVVSMWNSVTLVNLSCNLLHSGYVRGIAWSPDASLIASCGSDMNIVLWFGENLRPTGRVLTGHSSWVRWCKFTEDSKRLISSGDDHAVIVWDLAENIVSQTLRGHSHVVSCGSLVPGSDKLFTAGFDAEVLVWTKDTGLLGYLKVFVIEAFNLKRGDTITGNMSNARFVTIELGKGQRERTTFKKGSSPAWYEEFDFGVWDLDEHVSIQVFDWDKDEAHRFLGSVKVSLDELVYAEEGVTDKEFDLIDDEGESGKAAISLRFTYRPAASVGEVTVFVERARNLPRMDTFGLSDPFCMVSLGKSEKQKTHVVKHNLNPEWNEEFVYNVEEGARELKLVVYDWNFTLEFEFIGQLIIPVETLMANPFTDSWYPLKAIDGTTTVRGEIKVRINFISGQERSDSKVIRFRRSPSTWPAFARSDFNFYNPVGQVSFLGRVLLRGKCGFCGKHRNDHENDLRCDLGTGNYVHSIDLSYDGTLVAWGTGDGRIRLALSHSAERIACWTAHAGPVCGLKFSPWDFRLISWGRDYRTLKATDLVRGAYIPKQVNHSQDPPVMVVETWYIASLLEDRERWKKRNNSSRSLERGPSDLKMGSAASESAQLQQTDTATGAAPGEEKQPNSTEDTAEQAQVNNAVDDDDAEEGEKEDQTPSEKKRARRAREAGNGSKGKDEADKAAAIKHRLQKGASRKIQGRVGYTPVYYDPPLKGDGTLARSCLKGRSGRKPTRSTLSFVSEPPVLFTYPPEDTSSNEDDD